VKWVFKVVFDISMTYFHCVSPKSLSEKQMKPVDVEVEA